MFVGQVAQKSEGMRKKMKEPNVRRVEILTSVLEYRKGMRGKDIRRRYKFQEPSIIESKSRYNGKKRAGRVLLFFTLLCILLVDIFNKQLQRI